MATQTPLIQLAFQHRSGRVISLGRVVLSVFFTLAIWLDPARSARADDLAFLLVLGYTLFAYAVLLLTWNNWWNESRLSAGAHAVDLTVFTILIFLTEGYVSPFFSFFVFLVLSASIRWGWREALLTTALVIALFFAAAFIATNAAGLGHIEIQRFVARAGNLLVLSLMIVWFGVNQPRLRGGGSDGEIEEPADAAGPPVRRAMAHVAKRLPAGRILFAWTEADEPWLNIWDLRNGALEKAQLRPDEFARLVGEDLADGPFLFDLPRRRALYLRSGRRHSATRDDSVDEGFAERFGIDAGLAFPIRTNDLEGEIIALQVPGLCSDDLKLAAQIAEDINTSFERTALFVVTEEAATARARLHLARDLHDSVVQVFAGIALKLHALNKTIVADAQARKEIEDLQDLLVEEQRDLRGLIAALRDPRSGGRDGDPGHSIHILAERLESQWGVACDVSLEPLSLETPPKFQHDLEQFIREAVANAVRHGAAKRVSIGLSINGGRIGLTVADDGSGFPVEGEFGDAELRERRIGPRSLHERVQSLGGTMTLASSRAAGSQLAVSLPIERAAS